MNSELEAALDVFEDLLATLERNFESDEKLKEIDITAFTHAWRKKMEKQVAIANIKLK